MYRTSVPVMVHAGLDKEKTLAALRQSGADTVFLAITRKMRFRFSSEEDLALLRELVPYFEAAGLTVGVWVGETMGHDWGEVGEYTSLVMQDGTPLAAAYCPLDPHFSRDICDWIARVAACGEKLMLIDDDFRLSRYSYGMTCFCERHRRAYAERVGEYLTPAEICKKVYTGRGSRYRDEWLGLLGDTLRGFAREIRAAVDRVDPRITVGFCGCLSTWDLDGVESSELAAILAGEGNRPLLRLIGAPYWLTNCRSDRKMHDIVDLERLLAYHVRDLGMTVLSEGDTYPRPRYAVPASYLEGFDTLLHADGNFDGIHKYTMDYYASPAYETGYYRAAEKDRALHEGIERLFGGKRAVGIRHPGIVRTIREAELPEEFEAPGYGLNDGACLIGSCSLPMTFEKDTSACPLVLFGEDARQIDPSRLSHGAVINLTAARILTERGIDVGLQGVGERLLAPTEEFSASGERVKLFGGKVYSVRPKETATVESRFIDDYGERYDGTYRYRNAEGQTFLVLPFTVWRRGDQREEGVLGIYESYERQKQIADFAASLGAPLPALCMGHPDLYLLVKDGEGRRTVGLWNFFADGIETPVVTLPAPPKRVTACLGCTAEPKGREVHLSPIAPHAMAAFEVEL